MADFVNPSTLELAPSVSEKPAPWIVCTRDNLLAWNAIPLKYRKWVTDHIEEMTAGEKATADAAIESAREAAEIALYDTPNVQKAVALVIKDELNAHAAKVNAILSAVDAATSLADLKSRVAAIADLPMRQTQDIKTAITNKLATL